jgi:hypothetical protein
MTSDQLYDLLEDAGVEFEVVEIFDGLRTINVVINDEED